MKEMAGKGESVVVEHYPYHWSINVGINPIHWFWITVWVGDTHFDWMIRHPFKIDRGMFR